MKDSGRDGFLPLGYSYLKNEDIHAQVKEFGYSIVPFLDSDQLAELQKLYQENHSINQPGFFFSIFNNDWEYRKKITEQSTKIIESSLQKYFQHYKIGYSGFVVRGPKDDGEMFIHQDPSFVDESKFSPMHIWCPLYDITMEFAPVCVVPKSHHLASLHRCNSIAAPFDSIRNDVRNYLQPLLLKAGEVIFLDPRLIHNSMPNKTEKARPVLLAQIFPEEANYETPYLRGNDLELYALPENYFIMNSNFYENVEDKPALGTLVSKTAFTPRSISLEEFVTFCVVNDLRKTDMASSEMPVAKGINLNP